MITISPKIFKQILADLFEKIAEGQQTNVQSFIDIHFAKLWRLEVASFSYFFQNAAFLKFGAHLSQGVRGKT